MGSPGTVYVLSPTTLEAFKPALDTLFGKRAGMRSGKARRRFVLD
jgi:hypothetical protein